MNMHVCIWKFSFHFRIQCQFTGQVFMQTDFWNLWAQLYSKSFIVSLTLMILAFYCKSYINGQILCSMSLSMCISALRGASSRRKKNSLHGGKSASQEFLSPLKDKKEEKKAQSMDNLDGNCEINLIFQQMFFVIFQGRLLWFTARCCFCCNSL